MNLSPILLGLTVLVPSLHAQVGSDTFARVQRSLDSLVSIYDSLGKLHLVSIYNSLRSPNPIPPGSITPEMAALNTRIDSLRRLRDSLERDARETARAREDAPDTAILSTAQRARIHAQDGRVRFGIAHVGRVSRTIYKGFDLGPVGRSPENNEHAYLGEHLRSWMDRTSDRVRKCNMRRDVLWDCSYLTTSGFSYDPNYAVELHSAFVDSVAVAVVAVYEVTALRGALTIYHDNPSDLDELDASTEHMLNLLYGRPRKTQEGTAEISTWTSKNTTITRRVNPSGGQFATKVAWTWRRR